MRAPRRRSFGACWVGLVGSVCFGLVRLFWFGVGLVCFLSSVWFRLGCLVVLVCLAGWLVGGSVDDLFVGCLAGCFVGRLLGWLVGLAAGWLGGWVAGWLAGWLVGWLAGWLAGWLVGWLAGWLAGWLISWTVGLLDGWLVCWFGLVLFGRLFGCLVGFVGSLVDWQIQFIWFSVVWCPSGQGRVCW